MTPSSKSDSSVNPLLAKAERETEDRFQKYYVCRAKLSDESKNGRGYDYTGVGYRNTFKVDGGDIFVTGVKFFGAVKKKAKKAEKSGEQKKAPADTLDDDVLTDEEEAEPNPENSKLVPYTATVVLETPVWTLGRDSFYGQLLYFMGSKKIHKNYKMYGRTCQTVRQRRGKAWKVVFDPPIHILENKYVDIRFEIETPEKVMGYSATGNETCSKKVSTEFGDREFYFLAGSGQMGSLEFETRPTRR